MRSLNKTSISIRPTSGEQKDEKTVRRLQTPLFMAALFLLPASAVNAAGFHYCNGKVIDIITRGSDEGTQVRVDGMNGWGTIGYGGDAQKEMHKRQIAMLLTGYALGKAIQLEFEDDSVNCSMDHNNRLIRFVRLGG